MSNNFGEYPPNLPVRDALIVREQAGPDHAVVPYTGEDLARPRLGPANPFRDESDSAAALRKRKNVLTGLAEETYISEHTFRSKHRAVERRGGPEREFVTGKRQKEINKALRSQREGKGSATIADGDGAYVGPWAKYKRDEYELVEVDDGEELGSEYEIVTDEDGDGQEEEVVESGTVVKAPAENLARRKQIEELGEETTTFHGSEEHDYLGRTYMHVPQDLGFSLAKEVGSVTNFVPKKVVQTWRHHAGRAVTALQLFPASSHLGLSGDADGHIKIWDVYRSRELLRTFAGHNKAITDLSFSGDGGRKFLSGGFDRRIRLWDTETGQCVNRFNCGKTPHVIKFNPSAENGHEFLAGLSDNRIVQYDSRAGNETVQEYDHHLGAINTLEFIDESRRFMSTSDDRSLRVWEYGIPVEIKTIRYVSLFAGFLCWKSNTNPCLFAANPTCLPSPNRQSTQAASMSFTNAATTPLSPTRLVQTSSDNTVRRHGAGTTRPAVASVCHAVRTDSSLCLEIQAAASVSGTSRHASCTANSRRTAGVAPSTALRGPSRSRARCLLLAPREISSCGIRNGERGDRHGRLVFAAHLHGVIGMARRIHKILMLHFFVNFALRHHPKGHGRFTEFEVFISDTFTNINISAHNGIEPGLRGTHGCQERASVARCCLPWPFSIDQVYAGVFFFLSGHSRGS